LTGGLLRRFSNEPSEEEKYDGRNSTERASWGFMLPVSTPPNAIVYGSSMVSITAMIRAGIFFDILGALVI